MNRNKGEKLLISILLIPFVIVIHGFVLSILWDLFIVSTFRIASISVIQAAGVMFVIDFILLKIDWKDEALNTPMREFAIKWIAHSLVAPFVILGMGYILAMFL